MFGKESPTDMLVIIAQQEKIRDKFPYNALQIGVGNHGPKFNP